MPGTTSASFRHRHLRRQQQHVIALSFCLYPVFDCNCQCRDGSRKNTAQSLGLGKFSGLPGVLNLPAKVELLTCIKTHTPASDKYAGGPRRETPYQAQYRGEIIAYRMLAQTDRLIPMDEIVYYDRYRKQELLEKVYGDKFLRWTYGTLGGWIALTTMVKRAWFSHWYGWRMDRPASAKKIAPFIDEYELDPTEFRSGVDEFANFNEFFYRQLKPAARPIDPDPDSVVFPADGRHLCIPDISRAEGLFVKGEMFCLQDLLGDTDLAGKYATGSLVLSRLCPVDYHRFHFPVSGIPGQSKLLNGPLFSVNPLALVQNIQILASNKRCLTRIQTDTLGEVLLLEIGATCVGGIRQTYSEQTRVTKGDEKGYFRFGGSSTMTIFEPGRIQFDDDLLYHSQRHRELYARVGDRMGRCA